MKRKYLIVLSVLLTISLIFTGCSSGDERSEILNDAMDQVSTDLREAITAEEFEFSEITDYVTDWAKQNNVDVIASEDSYIVLKNPATDGSKEIESVILQCSLNTANHDEANKLVSAGLVSLIGPEKHNDISLVLTAKTNGEYIGAEEISSKYLKADNIINIIPNEENSHAYVSGGYKFNSVFTNDISRTAPTYEKAYKIHFSMTEFADPMEFSKTKNYPNPINILGNLLANAKSSGKLFQLASFTSSGHEGYMPYEATAVIVLDSNNVEGFNNKFKKSYENAEKRFDKVDDTFEYTIEETDYPSSVLSVDSCDKLVSIMYTLSTGICNQDEETGVINSASYSKYMNIGDNKMTYKVDTITRNTDETDTLKDVYATTSGLCNINSRISDYVLRWSASEDSALCQYFTEKYPADEDSSNIEIKMTDCSIIAAKAGKANVVSYYCEGPDKKEILDTVVGFIDSFTAEEE